MKLHESESLVKEYDEEHGLTGEETLYVPVSEYGELYREYHANNVLSRSDEVSIRGVEVQEDASLKQPKILPDVSNPDYPEVLKDPPEKHIERLIDVKEKEFEDTFRRCNITQYTAYAWLKPFCKWQRLDDEKIEKYGHPISNRNLRVCGDENCEYTKTDFSYYERQKFGFENSTTPEAAEIDFEDGIEPEGEIVRAIHNALWSVHLKDVYAVRERTIKGAYPVLDVKHREEIKFGKHGTTYEGMFMRHVDENVHKYEIPDFDGIHTANP
jgi:hypothetical protein